MRLSFSGCFFLSFFLVVVHAETASGQTSGAKAAAVPSPLHERANAMLAAALKDKNPDTRKAAVQALGLASQSEPYLSQLEDALRQDKDIEVKQAAIASLVDLKNARTVPVLTEALESNVPEVSFDAAKALFAMNETAGREALVAVLMRETKTSSGFITKQKRDMIRMLHTPRTAFLFALRQSVGLAPVPGLGAGVSSLQGILADSGTSGRAATALLLGSDRSPEVMAALQDALEDSDGSVRAAAVHAIAVRNDRSKMAILIPLLDDKKDAVRLRAAAGYLRLEAVQPPQAPKRPAAGKTAKKAAKTAADK